MMFFIIWLAGIFFLALSPEVSWQLAVGIGFLIIVLDEPIKSVVVTKENSSDDDSHIHEEKE